jgi:hypothetical protein
MVVYNPNIPLSTDLVSASQSPIQNNFFQADAQFGIDHSNFDTGGVNGNGFHKQVTLQAPVAASGSGTQAIIHSVNGANFFTGVPIPFVSNSSGDFPMIPDVLTSGTQFAFKIGNVIINYGYITLTASSTTDLNYPVGFTYTSASSFVINVFNNKIIGSNSIRGAINTSGSQSQIATDSITNDSVYYISIGT